MRKAALRHRSRNQNRHGWVKRQHVVRQLGGNQFEDEPRRHQPGEQELRCRLAMLSPHIRRGDRGQRCGRPERHPEHGEIITGRPAMRLPRAEHFAQQVMADRFDKEIGPGTPEDRDEPRQHEQQQPNGSGSRAQAHEPVRGAIPHDEGCDSERDHHEDHRTLQQHAAGKRGPENRRERPLADRTSRYPGRRPCERTGSSLFHSAPEAAPSPRFLAGRTRVRQIGPCQRT